MTDEIICGECPKIYRPSDIDAKLTSGETVDGVTKLADVQRIGTTKRLIPQQTKKSWLRLVGLGSGTPSPAEPGPDLDSIGRLRAWTFTCPVGHPVDGNQGVQFPVAVLGASGASKSHFLPAIVYDLDNRGTLEPLGVTLADTLHRRDELANNVAALYEGLEQLPPTPENALLGPFGHRLQVTRDDGGEDTRSLLLFDVSGESLSDVVKIAENAAFILLCKAIVVLIDPVGIMPTQFDDGPLQARKRESAIQAVRASIGVIAEVLQEVWHRPSKELPIPICFVIAKADAVEWADSFPWASQTAKVLDAAGDGQLRPGLEETSAAVRDAFLTNGGDRIVAQIENRFNPAWVRYVAASATSQMPDRSGDTGTWSGDPTPEGVALTILHVLDLAGVVTRHRSTARR